MPRPKSKKGTKANREKYVREDKLTEKIALEPEQIRYVAIQLSVTPQVVPHMENSPFAAFHKKDVGMINNHPMAWYLREQQAYLKRRNHKLHRQEHFASKPPEAPWDQTLRSRFPSFADAVHELDDALTTVSLFAQMSGDTIIPSDRITHCRRILAEFHYYVSRNRLVSKAFISVRGFYFQANIEGQDVTWLVPHPFPVPKDDSVDYKVLLAFLDLYEHLLEFVNAHLFIRLGLKYPPEYDPEKWDDGFYIDAIIDHSTNTEAEESLPQITQSTEEPSAATVHLQELLSSGQFTSTEQNDQSNLEGDVTEVTDQGIFSRFKFTISHDLHPDLISFVIHCLGGAVEWDEDSIDPTITHTITDRDFSDAHQRVLNRAYVQPQWVFDCLNQKAVLNASLYAVGVPLPPHVSPFEKQHIQEEEPGDDEREVEIGENESDQEIDAEIRRLAEEQFYTEGVMKELNEDEEPTEKISLQEMKAKKLIEKKEEMERLAAGTLSHKKTQLYKKLKEKETKKKVPLKRRLQEEEEENEKIKEGALEGEEEDFEEEEEFDEEEQNEEGQNEE